MLVPIIAAAIALATLPRRVPNDHQLGVALLLACMVFAVSHGLPGACAEFGPIRPAGSGALATLLVVGYIKPSAWRRGIALGLALAT